MRADACVVALTLSCPFKDVSQSIYEKGMIECCCYEMCITNCLRLMNMYLVAVKEYLYILLPLCVPNSLPSHVHNLGAISNLVACHHLMDDEHRRA